MKKHKCKYWDFEKGIMSITKQDGEKVYFFKCKLEHIPEIQDSNLHLICAVTYCPKCGKRLDNTPSLKKPHHEAKSRVILHF